MNCMLLNVVSFCCFVIIFLARIELSMHFRVTYMALWTLPSSLKLTSFGIFNVLIHVMDEDITMIQIIKSINDSTVKVLFLEGAGGRGR